ncbi:MAG: RluA family pseudouridine synthase [Lachnospiraceae bacterium]|nr:RluA family pseudouridine synthase [Lachnospiraceae bacterium]
MKEYTLIVEEDYENDRVDRYVRSVLADFSRSYIQKLIENHELTINNEPVRSSCRVKTGDVIHLVTSEQIPDILPQDIPLDILYEDEDILIINKPKDMVVHPAPGHYDNTVVNAVMFHCKDLSGINGVLRPGIVHRIDKDTTGSLVICKNDFAHEKIASQLKEHTIKREYIAIVTGVINEAGGTVDKPLGRSKTNRLKMAVDPDGKRAVTHYEVISRSDKFTLIRCRLETGRTHQIRVHMAYIGHPVAGDPIYGNGRKTPVDTRGQALHAEILGLVHPRTGEYIEVKAPLPDYFRKFADTFEKV